MQQQMNQQRGNAEAREKKKGKGRLLHYFMFFFATQGKKTRRVDVFFLVRMQNCDIRFRRGRGTRECEEGR